MIVFPLCRFLGLRAVTSSSSVATLPMLVRSRPSRTRWTISLSWARSDSTTKSIARPSAGRRPAGPPPAPRGPRVPPGADQVSGPFLDAPADDVEHQVDAADVFQCVVLKIDELLRAEVQ